MSLTQEQKDFIRPILETFCEDLCNMCVDFVNNDIFSMIEINAIKDNIDQYPFYKPSKPAKNLAGNKYNRLKVLYRTKTPEHAAMYVCLCDCGNIKIIRGQSLEHGKVKSCGCYKIELNKQKKHDNEYDLSGAYGIGYTYDTHEPFYFDLEDYDKIKIHAWKKDENGYVVSKRSTSILMHRLILDITNPEIHIDHIKHINYDNRKSELRATTCHNNTMNEKLAINNTSGVTGVCWEPETNKWHSYIWYNGKTIHLGRFVKKEDAIKARIEGENKYFGEFGYHNSMGKE